MDYSEEESEYLSALRGRLEEARNARNASLEEFDQMDYLTWFDTNERLANTFVGKKLNKSDTNYQSGMIRNKIFTFLASINKMNLEAVALAFDKKNLLHANLGNAITEVLRKTEELENDDEKRLIRQYELIKQGTIFVEDIWKKSYKTTKKLAEGFNGDPKTAKWTTELEEAISAPCRTILYGPGVYLGSMSTFDMADQPYIFTVDVVPYEKAKAMFGKWDNWESVPKTLVQEDSTGILRSNWRLTDLEQNQVEIIKYQDKPNDEFQILLNGVMMLPVGYPLSAVSCNGEYTVVKQILKMIRHNFPYGKSLVMELRNLVGIWDELAKLDVLKAQQAVAPAMANNTGQTLTSRNLMPGTFTAGIPDGKLFPMNPAGSQGVTNADLSMLEFLSQRIDEASVNKSYQGGEAPGSTLGEAQIAHQQSSLIIDLVLFSCSLLEKKLGELRVPMILKYWFDPIDKRLDEARNELTNVYRISNIEASISGRGMGRSMVIPQTGMLPAGDEIHAQEEADAKEMGQPVRKYYVNPDEIKKAEYIWQVTVNPTPRRGDAQQKLLFESMATRALNMFGPRVNIDHLAERFAETEGEDSSKLFLSAPPIAQGMPQGAPQPQPVQGLPQITPQTNRVNIPS